MALVVDKDLSIHHSDVADKVKVVSDLNARLVYIEIGEASGRDDFHVLQGLMDTSLAEDVEERFYYWQRWGATGSRGGHDLDGPITEATLRKKFCEKFKELTDKELGTIKPGDQAVEGKFWLQPTSDPDAKAQWQYRVDDGVDGKAPGWYPYEPAANAEVEEIYSQHVANERNKRTAIRIVSSGYFSYKVDLTAMTQTNTRTNKVREIRRALGEEVQSGEDGGEVAAKKVPRPMKPLAIKAMKAVPKSTPKAKPGAKKVVKEKKVIVKAMKKVAKAKLAKLVPRAEVAKLVREAKAKARSEVQSQSKGKIAALTTQIRKLRADLKKAAKAKPKFDKVKVTELLKKQRSIAAERAKKIRKDAHAKEKERIAKKLAYRPERLSRLLKGLEISDASKYMKTKTGKIVKKKAYNAGLNNPWSQAVQKAVTELAGEPRLWKKGSKVYIRAKEIMEAAKAS